MDISVAFIEYHRDKLADLLAIIFTRVYLTGQMPKSWKVSYLTPIPKKGDSSEVRNYRGIAIASTIPKLYDKLLTRKLYPFLSKFIPAEKHGFMYGRSTTSNLMETAQFIGENMRNGTQVDAISFDFSKAFDSIDFRILAVKLAKASLPLTLYHVIMSFVVNRRYVLKVGTYSGFLETMASSGVPQGSHMGPLLLIFYIADILNDIDLQAIFARLFADDTKFLSVIRCQDDVQRFQVTINKLVNWTSMNRLPLNDDKTKFVSYFASRSRPFDTSYYVNTSKIKRSSHQLDLGVIFDEKMSFRLQFESVIAKARLMYSVAVRFARESKCNDLIGIMYKTYILPIIEHNSTVWGWENAGLSSQLEKIQRDCTRAMLRAPFRPNVEGYLTYHERLCKLSMTRR